MSWYTSKASSRPCFARPVSCSHACKTGGPGGPNCGSGIAFGKMALLEVLLFCSKLFWFSFAHRLIVFRQIVAGKSLMGDGSVEHLKPQCRDLQVNSSWLLWLVQFDVGMATSVQLVTAFQCTKAVFTLHSLLPKSPQRLLLAVSMWSPPTFAWTPANLEMGMHLCNAWQKCHGRMSTSLWMLSFYVFLCIESAGTNNHHVRLSEPTLQLTASIRFFHGFSQVTSGTSESACTAYTCGGISRRASAHKMRWLLFESSAWGSRRVAAIKLPVLRTQSNSVRFWRPRNTWDIYGYLGLMISLTHLDLGSLSRTFIASCSKSWCRRKTIETETSPAALGDCRCCDCNEQSHCCWSPFECWLLALVLHISSQSEWDNSVQKPWQRDFQT